MSSSTQSSSTHYYQLSYKDLIEIDYFQSDRDKIFTTTNRRCCCLHTNTFHISLKVDQVCRMFLFSPEDNQTRNMTVYDAPIIEHCLPYVSNDRVCPDKVGRFRVATRIPEQIMSRVMDALWSFAQEVVPVVTKDGGFMVRPFTMIIKQVKLEYYDRVRVRPSTRSLPNVEEEEEDVGTSKGYGFEDCFEKVRFDGKICEESQSCSICFEDFATGMDLRRLPCSHIYHGECIVKWLGTKPACPLCRFSIME